MQATTTTPPTPPAPPAPLPGAAAPVTVTFTGADGVAHVLTVPLTRQAMRDLRAQREELSRQLINVSNRRHELSEEIKTAPSGASRTGLEQRLAVLDQRIVQLESDIAATGKQLSAAPLGLIQQSADIPRGRNDIPPVFGPVIAFLVLFPIALAVARFIWRRAGKTAVQSTVQLSPQIDQRLERLEAGIDAIAIEIERVTEGQRFVTRLLSEQDSREKLPASGGSISS